MEPFRSIIACTDFSDTGNRALSRAFAMAGPKAAVTLVHVITPPAALNPLYAEHAPPSGAWDVETEARLMNAARSHLLSLVPVSAREFGLTVTVDVGTGPVLEEVLRLAVHHHAEVIVVGAQGRCDGDRMLAGSLAERLVRVAARPVLVSY
jgi:nucleotide-binding universal stress UspA family protein